jgi:hypothetical protein
MATYKRHNLLKYGGPGRAMAKIKPHSYMDWLRCWQRKDLPKRSLICEFSSKMLLDVVLISAFQVLEVVIFGTNSDPDSILYESSKR